MRRFCFFVCLFVCFLQFDCRREYAAENHSWSISLYREKSAKNKLSSKFHYFSSKLVDGSVKWPIVFTAFPLLIALHLFCSKFREFGGSSKQYPHVGARQLTKRINEVECVWEENIFKSSWLCLDGEIGIMSLWKYVRPLSVNEVVTMHRLLKMYLWLWQKLFNNGLTPVTNAHNEEIVKKLHEFFNATG